MWNVGKTLYLYRKIYIFFLVLLVSFFAWSAPQKLSFQAKILKPNGKPLIGTVSFRFTVTDALGTCVIYQEDHNGVSMSDSSGNVLVAVGTGTQSYPSTTLTISEIFDNNYNSFTCKNGGVVSTAPSDSRKLAVQFNDGGGWQTISGMDINSVPYAVHAESALKLGGYDASEYLKQSSIPTCSVGQALHFNGSSFTCVSASGGGGGSVSTVTSSNSYLSVASSTTTPQLTLNVGTASGTVAAGNDSRIANALQTTTSFSGDATGTYNNLVLSNVVASGTATKVTFDTKGRIISSTSLSSSDVVTALGFTPVSSTNAGTVTNVSGAGPIQVTSGSSSPVISIQRASGTQDGFLASSDWSIFNSKQDALGFTPANVTSAVLITTNHSGDVTGTYNNLILNNTGVTSGTYTKVSVDAKGRVTASSSLNSSDISSALGFTPVSSTNAGTVTQVSSTNPFVSVATSTTTPVITIARASGTQDGFLASADWSIFNNKLGTASSFSGDVTGTYNNLILNNVVTSGTATKVTFDSKGRIISSASLNSSDITSALGFTPVSSTNTGTVTQVSSTNPFVSVTASTTTPVITIAQASSTQDGFLASTDWSIFNSKQDALGFTPANVASAVLITTNHSGDVTGTYNNLLLNNTGVVSGTYTKVSVDAKGRVTASSSLNSSDITIALGYTPVSAAGAGSVTQVSSTNPFISIATSTTTPVITIARASSTQDGFLSSTDWSTFNSKQDALGFTPANVASSVLITTNHSGDVTGTYNNLVLNNVVTSGTATKVTFDTKGRIISSSSLNSTDITSALGFTPVSSTNAGTVTQVSSTNPFVSIATSTTTPVITIAQASATQDGFLSSTDWSTFNSKQNALGFTPANVASSVLISTVHSGDVTGTYNNLVLNNVVSSGTATKVTFDTKGRIISSSSLNSSDITSALGFTPVSSTNAGTVTQVSSTNPFVSVATSTTTPVITIARASGTQDGFLSSTDWSTFNSKQDALGFTPASAGQLANYLPLTGGNLSGNLNLQNNKLLNVKNVAGTSLDPSASEDGKTLRWNNTSSQWEWFTAGAAGAGIASINGASGTAQTLQVGSTGSDFGINTSGTVHTFNIPTATSSARGLLNSSDWSIFSAKLGTASNFSGDVTGTYNNLVLNNVVTSGTATKVTFDTKGRIISSSSLNSSDITSALGFTPVSSTNAGTVTQVSSTNPFVSVATSTTTPVITIARASGTQDGFLSSTDWSIFNSKQNALGFTPANVASSVLITTVHSGDVTGTYNNLVLNNVVSSGTATKVTFDTKGRIVSSSSLNSSDITSALGFTPVSSTNAGTVTQVSSTNPFVSIATSTTTPVITIARASGTQDGFLSSTDWSVFNNKQNALGFTPASAGQLANYLPLTGGSLSGNLNLQNNRLLNVKNVAGTSLDPTASEDGKALRWNNTSSQWEWFTAGAAGAGIASINGASGTSQSFSTGSSGSDFGINTSGTVHTFNIPTATSSARGLLSSSDWSIFSTKLGTATSFSGDVTGTYNNLVLNNVVTSGTATKVTFDTKGRIISSSSLNSSDITSALGFTPVSSTNAGTVTQVSSTNPFVSVATSTTTPVITIARASGTQDGFLASSDWSIFNAKLGTTTAHSGDVTGTYNNLILNNTGVTSGTYTKVSVDAKGRVTASSSLNSSDITSALGFTPVSSTNAGTVTQVSSTNPFVSVATSTTTPVITIARASGTQDGFLASTDWSTFNNKLNNSLGNGLFWIGNASGVVQARLMSGDATMNNSGVLTLVNTGVTSGTYAKVSVDAKGRVTASGVLNSSDITTALGFTPVSSTNAGTVTQVSSTNPFVSVATSTTTPVITIARASGTQDGFLASTDWSIFNAKLGTTTAHSGDVTGTYNNLILNNTGVVSGTYSKVSVDAKGRVTGSSALNSSDITTALGFIPSNATSSVVNGGQSGAVTIGSTNSSNVSLVTSNTARISILASGDVGIGTASPDTNFEVVGDIMYNNSRTYGFTRTLPTVVNDTVDLGSISLTSGGGVFWISIVVPSASFSLAKSYSVPVKWSHTAGAWVVVQPLSDTGAYSGNNIDLDVSVASGVATFRIRRTGGSTAGTAYVSILHQGVNTNTFVSSTVTSSVAAPTQYLQTTAIREVASNVGVGVFSPERLLHVAGPIRIEAGGLPSSPESGDISIDSGDGNKLKWYNGSSWQTAGGGAGSSGTVTSITAGTGLTGGSITTSGTIAVDVGTTANKILQLDGSSRIPAVDGSLLTSVNATKINTVSVSATLPSSAGHVLRYTGSIWEPKFIGLSDIRSIASGNAAVFPKTCGASETLTYSAGTDTYSCTSISGLPASAISSGIINTARLGSGSANVNTFLRGDGSWQSPNNPWVTLTGNTTLAVSTNYLSNGSSRLQLTIPSTCTVGEMIKVVSISNSGFQIVIPSGITIKQGSNNLDSSTNYYVDSSGGTVDLVCTTANSVWSQQGAATPSSSSSKHSMALGYINSCAVFGTNKELKCWGYNGNGQLGYGDTTDRCKTGAESCIANLPAVNLGAGRSVKKVVSNYHTCVIMDNDQVKCWGYNGWGQLGYGDTTARCNTGGTTCASSLAQIDLGAGRTAKDIYVEYGSTCIILDNNDLKCIGLNGNGQLGYGDTTSRCNTGGSTCFSSLAALNLGASRYATKVAIGSVHTCAVLDNGTVKCWGYNGHGQLGIGSTTAVCTSGGSTCISSSGNSYVPAGRTAVDISVDYHSSCIKMDDSNVVCWGYNGYGGLGTGDTTARCTTGGVGCSTSLPAVINLGAGRTANQVRVGQHSVCVLLDDATVKCWGYNQQGQLGKGSTTTTCSTGGSTCVANLTPLDFGNQRSVKNLYAATNYNANGGYHYCAILDNDQIKCWGRNDYGQLGYGDMTYRCNSGGVGCLSALGYLSLDSNVSVAAMSLYGGGGEDTGGSCTNWGGASCSGNTLVCQKGTKRVTGTYTYISGCVSYTVTNYICVQ